MADFFFQDTSFQSISGGGNTWSMLFAYSNTSGGVNIADVQFHTTSGSAHLIVVTNAEDLAYFERRDPLLGLAEHRNPKAHTTDLFCEPIHFIPILNGATDQGASGAIRRLQSKETTAEGYGYAAVRFRPLR